MMPSVKPAPLKRTFVLPVTGPSLGEMLVTAYGGPTIDETFRLQTSSSQSSTLRTEESATAIETQREKQGT